MAASGGLPRAAGPCPRTGQFIAKFRDVLLVLRHAGNPGQVVGPDAVARASRGCARNFAVRPRHANGTRPASMPGREDRAGLLGDLPFLVGPDHEHFHDRLARMDDAHLAGGCCVSVGVQAYTQRLQTGARPRAYRRRVLADAGGEHDRVRAAERGVVRADVLAQPIAIDVEREARAPRRPPCASALRACRWPHTRPSGRSRC